MTSLRLLYGILVVLSVLSVLSVLRKLKLFCHAAVLNDDLCVDDGHCKATIPLFISPCVSKTSIKAKQLSYQVVIDAGSTGSRIHIFTFRRTLAGLILEKADFSETEPGLSSYLNKPEEGAYSVNKLLQQALAFVPKKEWTSTPVSLKATAGLRLLPELVAEKIMSQVRNVLLWSPFQVLNSDFASVMDGDDEGIFAWITLNFLTDNLNEISQRTNGALDLGGGSTQIVFKPMSQDTILSSPQSHLNTVKILGTQYNLYSYSYLGLGLMSARQAVFGFTSLDNNVNGINRSVTTSPCIFPMYKGIWSFSGKEIMIQGNNSFSYENCLHYVKEIVTEVHQPDEIVNRDFYAFSYYYDIALSLGLIGANTGGGALSLGSYIKATKKACSNESKAMLATSPFLCLDSIYITTLLRNGYGFQETQIFHLTKKIKNVELSWALGAALHMVQS